MKIAFPTIFRPASALLALSITLPGWAQTTPAPAPQQTAPAAGSPATPVPGQLPAAGAPAQSAQDDKQFTITRQVNEVDLVFTVTDKHGDRKSVV